MTTTATTDRSSTTASTAPPIHRDRRNFRRYNWFGGAMSWVWLLIVLIPIYWIVITSFKTQSNYFATNPLAPPTSPSLENYTLVIQSDFIHYFLNSLIVTVGAVVPAVLMSFMAAFAIVRASDLWFLRGTNSLFLMGLALFLRWLSGGSASDSMLEGA